MNSSFNGRAGQVLDAIGDWICNLDRKGCILCANAAMTRGLGRESASLAGTPFLELAPPDVRDAIRSAWQEAAATGAAQDCQHETVAAYGELRWRQWTFQRLAPMGRGMAAGEPGATVLAIGRDVTEQKLLEHRLRHAQRLGSVGALASGIAHDLGNVLAPLVMSAELLQLHETSEKKRALLDVVAASARRGAGLVRQVLSISRDAADRFEQVDAGVIALEVARFAARTFTRAIHVKTEVAPELWQVCADSTQIHQVLLNLCVNARDAMPQGGELVISAANVLLDETAAQTAPDAEPGRYVALRVADTGMGIASEIAGRVFEPFFTTKAAGKGSGIGLATVHSIVKSYGGAIAFSTEVGRGTTFSVYLPASETPAGAPVDSTKPEAPPGRGEQVLVIDDEEIFRDVSRQVLEAFGYKVRTAGSAQEAMRAFERHGAAIAAVLLDLNMPAFNGWDAIKAFKAINPAVRVIAAGGQSDTEGQPAGNGIALRLTKPYSMTTLLQALRQVLA